MTESGDDMTCREVVDLVNDYLEGALTADEAARFERHLGTCDGCGRHLDQMRFTIEAVGRLREDDVPPQTRDRLLTVFRNWKAGSEIAE